MYAIVINKINLFSQERGMTMLYKVEAGKAEYLLHVLKRDRIDYTQSGNVVFNLPDDIDLDELQAKIPVYSKRTLENKEKLSRLQEYYGKKGFHVM